MEVTMGLANLFLGKWVGIGTALCLSLMLEAGSAYAFQNLEKDARRLRIPISYGPRRAGSLSMIWPTDSGSLLNCMR